MANFLGESKSFQWFVGVVEDRLDPLKAGRFRVRILGHHTSDKNILPTVDLPWSLAVMPTTSSGISGLGISPPFIVEGSWVYGYFRSANRQEAVIVGTMPGVPAEFGTTAKGFYDPNSRLDEKGQPTGVSVYPREINEPDVNRLAVANSEKKHASLLNRTAARTINVATADFDTITAADGSVISPSDTDSWSEPEISYNAIYPYNHVMETESGHVKEYDDTLNAERIHERHRTGTSYEMRPNGDLVTLVKNDSFTITSNDNKVIIGGDSDVTINGRHKIKINADGQANNNYDIQVGANANINIQVDTGNINLVTKQGKINVNAGGDYNVNVGGNYTMNVAGNRTVIVEGSTEDNTTGSVTHRGSVIDLNP